MRESGEFDFEAIVNSFFHDLNFIIMVELGVVLALAPFFAWGVYLIHKRDLKKLPLGELRVSSSNESIDF